MSILEVKDLKVYYPIKGGIFGRTVDNVKAVDEVSFSLKEGETYGVIGESGSGKSTIGKAITGLTKVTSGSIHFYEKNLLSMNSKEQRNVRKDISMIFQDPFSSLNPKKRVIDIMIEPIRNFENLSKTEEIDKAVYLLEKVGLRSEHIYKYPHEFSGGQRQRIGIARSIALQPKLIVADEPVSALDVSVQAQVLNFLKELQKEFKLTYLFIGHDLGVMQHMCDNIGVMYRGRMVEEGNAEDIMTNAQHIYTKRLLSAISDGDPEKREHRKMFRKEVEEGWREHSEKFFDESGRPFDLQTVSSSHKVSMTV